MTITIIGTGFVGVVSAAVYASFGHQVYGLDIDQRKIDSLKQGKVPFYEPDLEELLTQQQTTGNLMFTTDYKDAISQADIIFIAVGTPSAADGQADLKYVFAATDSLAPHLKDQAIVVVKSTVPPGTLPRVAERIQALTTVTFHLASVPEFLREGSAVHDTLHPDRIVIGATTQLAFDKLEELHQPLTAPVVKISPDSAQMAKYTANAYLATRITFINQIADLCEKNGADIQEVIQAIGHDKRIGSHYWYPGLGYGGSCFPKDVKELAAYSRSVGEHNNLLNKIDELNDQRITKLMSEFSEEIGGWSGKKVAVLGLAFKPHTDDMREAPSLKVVPYLQAAGAHVTGYDPKAEWNSWPWLPTDPVTQEIIKINQAPSLTEAVAAADVIIALIEWPEIVHFDFSQVNRNSTAYFSSDGHNDQKSSPWFIDIRNQFNPNTIAQQGFNYRGVGR